MNYAYIVGAIDESSDKYFNIMLDSLNNCCDCNVILNTQMENLLNTEFDVGDNVFVLTPDLLIQDDIFNVFDGSFDVAYTNRHYPSDSVVNFSVWAFTFNENSKKFIEFLLDQIQNPTWGPLLKFREKIQRVDTNHPWAPQDFLCAVYKNGHKIDVPCVIKDIGYKYNFWPAPRAFNLNE